MTVSTNTSGTNRRWLVPTIGLAVVALATWWIAHNTYWGEISVPTPLRGEAVKNPFYTAQRFVEALGATSEWRQSLGSPRTSDSIIVLNNWHWSLIAQRRKQLENWVQAGGRLVVNNTLTGGEEEFKTWSGLEITYPQEDPDEDESETEEEPEPQEDEASTFDYARSGVCGTLLASYSPKSSDLHDRYNVCQLAPSSWIVSSRPVFWALHDDDGMQATRVELGKGSVTLLNATPFGNRDLTQIDHGSLFVAVTQLQHSDHVIFVSEEEHPGVLTLIWRNGKPVVLLAALLIVVALWRGIVRFGPRVAVTETARRSLAEQIRGTGLFMLRFGGHRTLHAAMLRAVDDAARRRIVNYAHLQSAERVSALALAANLEEDKVSAALHHRENRNAHDLQHAIALLETVRRALLKTQFKKNPA